MIGLAIFLGNSFDWRPSRGIILTVLREKGQTQFLGNDTQTFYWVLFISYYDKYSRNLQVFYTWALQNDGEEKIKKKYNA